MHRNRLRQSSLIPLQPNHSADYVTVRRRPYSMGNDGGAEGHPLSSPAPAQATGQSEDLLNVNSHKIMDHTRIPKRLSDDSNPLWSPEYLESGEGSQNGRPGKASGEEILRRLSLTDERPKVSSRTKSRKGYPGLELSGNIISATFCVPYKIDYGSGGDWVEFGCIDC